MNHNTLGQSAETLIANRLKEDSFVILEQNYKKFFGEIDIIAQRQDTIVFVEVKARRNPRTSMFNLVSPAKQKKIILVAKDYIAHHNFINVTYRFDVALVEYVNDTQSISYIPNAF